MGIGSLGQQKGRGSDEFREEGVTRAEPIPERNRGKEKKWKQWKLESTEFIRNRYGTFSGNCCFGVGDRRTVNMDTT